MQARKVVEDWPACGALRLSARPALGGGGLYLEVGARGTLRAGRWAQTTKMAAAEVLVQTAFTAILAEIAAARDDRTAARAAAEDARVEAEKDRAAARAAAEDARVEAD